MAATPVEELAPSSKEEILYKISKRKPLILKNFDIGPCVDKWSVDYVSQKVGNQPVKIHVSKDRQLDFVNKNFLYKTLPFEELIKRIFCSIQSNYFITPDEYYYLRSLGTDARGKDVANFLTQCPELAEDIKIPPVFEEQNFFSSVFRASSKGLQLWTHYDIMDNILLQIKGKKRVILWPPTEVDSLYLIGDKSQVLEVDEPNLQKFPKFKKSVRYECLMQQGDVLFIPALWFHNTIAIEPSLGLNIFWKNLSHELYDKNDSYGNKDLIVAAKGIRSLETTVKSLGILPQEYKNFYIRRMINILQENLHDN